MRLADIRRVRQGWEADEGAVLSGQQPSNGIDVELRTPDEIEYPNHIAIQGRYPGERPYCGAGVISPETLNAIASIF